MTRMLACARTVAPRRRCRRRSSGQRRRGRTAAADRHGPARHGRGRARRRRRDHSRRPRRSRRRTWPTPSAPRSRRAWPARSRAARSASLDERERAVQQLEQAVGELDGCGAIRYRDAAERELRQLGQRVHRRSRPGDLSQTGVASLTERELEIARLIVDRKTNGEIAGELFLSKKTVETHIRNIFRKLDVSSRVDIARAVERRRPDRQLTAVPRSGSRRRSGSRGRARSPPRPAPPSRTGSRPRPARRPVLGRGRRARRSDEPRRVPCRAR